MIRITKEEYHKLFKSEFLRLLSRKATPLKTAQGEFICYSYYGLCWGVHDTLLKKEIRDGEEFYYASGRFYRERIEK